MKSEINRVGVGTTQRVPFKKNQLVIFTRETHETVLMLLSDEDEDGCAKVVCLYTNKNHGDWWTLGEVDQGNVSIMKLFTESLTLSN